MNKSSISVIILLITIFILGFFIYMAEVKRDNFKIINSSIVNILLLNKDLNIYMNNPLSYDNFDDINKKIIDSRKELEKINIQSKDLKNPILKENLLSLNTNLNKKLNTISKIKSYRAILNNSFRIFQKIYDNEVSSNLNHVYTFIMTLDNKNSLSKNKKLSSINKIIKFYKKDKEIYFLKHAKIILMYQQKFDKINASLKKLALEAKLNKFYSAYEQYSNKSIQNAYWSILILFLLLIILTFIFIIYQKRLVKSNNELYRFKLAVENSDNIVVVTDKNETIKYVNAAFTRTTGYTNKEAIGQKPNILKSGRQSEDFYKHMKETIYAGKVWSGEFINVDKYGDLSYEKASIAPVQDEKGNIKEFIAIKLDMTSERITENKLKEKEQLLIQQSKMAAMGEMLENIAHQWRQPLSVISTTASGILMQNALEEKLSEEELINNLNHIVNTSLHLSQTIESFRNFFRVNKNKSICNLNTIYEKAIKLVNSKFTSFEIEIIEDIDKSLDIETFDGELIQVIMNLLSNSKDILIKKDSQRYIFIKIYKEKNNAIISIKDNGGGIPTDIIDRIFEPYFTTKHKSSGTGIGLYMSREMVINHMGGLLSVENKEYTYKDKKYKGAEFKISLKT